MAKTERRLGRGLDSLVSKVSLPVSTQLAEGPTREPELQHQSGKAIRALMLPVEQLHANPMQPRRTGVDEGIESLAKSITKSGMLQAITVRIHSGKYEIIAGERRWRASKLAGLKEVPVMIRDATDEEMLELALVENIQREDLNAIDRAMAYRQFCREFDLRPEQVAERLGEDRTTVTNYLRLLDLSSSLKDRVASGELSMGHARCLLGVAEEDRRDQLAEAVVRNQLSVRALEEIVRREKTRRGEGDVGVDGASGPAEEPRAASPHVLDMQRRFEEVLKTKVVIREGRRKGRGRVILEYYSLDDFDRIAAALGVQME